MRVIEAMAPCYVAEAQGQGWEITVRVAPRPDSGVRGFRREKFVVFEARDGFWSLREKTPPTGFEAEEMLGFENAGAAIGYALDKGFEGHES